MKRGKRGNDPERARISIACSAGRARSGRSRRARSHGTGCGVQSDFGPTRRSWPTSAVLCVP